MRKSLKKAALIAAAGAMILGSAISAKAASVYNGQWCVENNGYWFKLTQDGSVFLANTWYWIKDSDGIIRSYYFDQNGWLATNQTIGDYTVNDQGQWVVDGIVQTRTDADGDYATHTDLGAAKSVSASSNTGSTAVGKTGNSKFYKASGQGDNPANASFTQPYENSSISGSTVRNNWANFTMTIAASGIKTDDTGSGTDFYIDYEDTSFLSVSYIPLDKYAAGNTSLDVFVNGYLADVRGYKGGSAAGDITLGAYSFKQLTKAVKNPEGTWYDHCYIRQVEGTNYAMVITVEQGGNSEDYLSSLNTMARVR